MLDLIRRLEEIRTRFGNTVIFFNGMSWGGQALNDQSGTPPDDAYVMSQFVPLQRRQLETLVAEVARTLPNQRIRGRLALTLAALIHTAEADLSDHWGRLTVVCPKCSELIRLTAETARIATTGVYYCERDHELTIHDITIDGSWIGYLIDREDFPPG